MHLPPTKIREIETGDGFSDSLSSLLVMVEPMRLGRRSGLDRRYCLTAVMEPTNNETWKELFLRLVVCVGCCCSVSKVPSVSVSR